MRFAVVFVCALQLIVAGAPFARGAESSPAPSVDSRFRGPPWNDPAFFPIAVWLQSPDNAARYRAAGINTYVGLWQGPTVAQLDKLKASGLRVICSQNQVALQRSKDDTILAWMHDDEPDNAQSLGEGKGYGPPVPPAQIIRDYQRMRSADPSRPVLLNLGQGVAWDGWYGRGVRTRHPEDYPEYIKGADIVSFDIYPAVHDREEIAGNLWYVAQGVERLVTWSTNGQRVWNCLECTRIGNEHRKPKPAEVRCEAWMSLIHGSRGLIYFVHQFKPQFREAALLDDPEMLAAVTALNAQIRSLAPVLNAGAPLPGLAVRSANNSVPVASLTRRHEGFIYLFAVAMRPGKTEVTFTLPRAVAGQVEVIDEVRSLEVSGGKFTDVFEEWGVHLYRARLAPDP